MLTRQQIDEFAAMASATGLVRARTRSWLRGLGLATFDAYGHMTPTPAGQDLLATIPHLPPVEVPLLPFAPACTRCGGAREVPIFMGPAMMPCPSCCANDPAPAAEESVRPVEALGDEWVHLASQEIALSFVGRRAEMRAPYVCDDYPQHPSQGRFIRVDDACDGMVFFVTDGLGPGSCDWSARGNVYLRAVPE